MDKIKIGIIGCGKQAPKHISGLNKVPGVELVLADLDSALAEKLAKKEGADWVENPNEIFADSFVHAVDICTPTPAHGPLIQQAVEAQKDFFCEKPLCETAAQAREIEALVQEHNRIGMVGYIYRFAQIFELGHNLFKDSAATMGESMVLGKVVSASARLGGRGGHQLWKHRKATSGGAINEMLVHMVDLAIWYFGPVADVEVLQCATLRPVRIIQGKKETVDAEDFILVQLKMACGLKMLCQADLVTPAFTQVMEVQCENGTFMGSIQPDMPSFVFCSQEAGGYAAGKTSLQLGQHNLFEAQMAEFVRAVRTREQPSRCTIADSRLLLEALEKLRACLKKG